MACFSCSTEESVTNQLPDVCDVIIDKFKSLSSVMPNVNCPCVVTREGILLSYLLNDEEFAVSVAASISTLQISAVYFLNIFFVLKRYSSCV